MLKKNALNDPQQDVLQKLAASEQDFFKACCDFLSEQHSFSFLQSSEFILQANDHYDNIMNVGISDAINKVSVVESEVPY